MKNISMKSTQLIEDSYTNYHHSVYLYIYYRIAHKEEAEDLAQDVYVRLMDYDRMLCAETIKYFIFTIARNLVTDYLRRYYKRQEVTSYLYEHTVAYTNETELRVVANDLEACEKYRLSLLPPRRRKILTDVMEICELVGKVSSTQHLSSDPVLRRQNRIKTIYSSLAIEQNTLSLEQVTAVLSGKRVLAPPKDIMEVKNAYEIYDHLNELNPYSVEDLLLAHHVMMRGLVQEDGVFRSKPVGVVDSHGNVLHFGTLPQYVPPLVEELLKWTEDSPLPMLIKSCVFHYEFEVIHPFADGNGRIGRLWHTLLLSRWNPLFAWLPVESIVHDHQQEYYEAINTSNAQGEGTAFIEFMLSVIEEALLSVIPENFEKSMMPTSGKENRWNILEKYLKKEKIIHNSDVQQLLEVSSATANRILVSFVKEGKLERVRDGRYWAYQKL